MAANPTEPKKLYVAFYYNAGGDDAYERAAITWKKAVEAKSTGYSEDKGDRVRLIPVGSDNQFKAEWEALNKSHRAEGYDIQGLIIFSHASADYGHNKPGLDFKDLEKDYDAVLTTRDPNEIEALSQLRWGKNAYGTLAGCNTANENFSSGETAAAAFAKRQGVPLSRQSRLYRFFLHTRSV